MLFRSPETVQFPIGTISQIVLFGNISITTPAIGLLLEKDVDVVFLSETGKFRGRLSSGFRAQVSLRKAQYRILDDWALCDVAPETLRLLGIPENHRSMYVMLFGYPAVRYARTVQRGISGVRRVALEK